MSTLRAEPTWADVLVDSAAEVDTAERLIRQLNACEVAALAFCRLLERWARGDAAPSTPGGRQAALRRAADRAETALTLVDEGGENQIVVAPGANSELGEVQVAGAVLCQLEIPLEAVASAAAGAGRFFLNAAPARPISAALVRAAEVVVVNSYELEALPETPRLTALTLGEEGAVLLEGGSEVARAQAPRVRAVDGTAAGDAFTACLVVSRLEERDVEEALRRACAAGAITASRPGAQPSLPTAEEVDEILSA